MGTFIICRCCSSLKKKPDHPVHTSLSGQVQSGQVRLSSVQSEVRLATLQTARSRNVLIQTAGQTNARVITTLAPPASPLLTSLKQNCLTEIDPNTGRQIKFMSFIGLCSTVICPENVVLYFVL